MSGATTHRDARHPVLLTLAASVVACVSWGAFVFAVASLLFVFPPMWFVFLATLGGVIVGGGAWIVAYLRWWE